MVCSNFFLNFYGITNILAGMNPCGKNKAEKILLTENLPPDR